MASPTDDAIRKIMEKTLNMVTQTNSGFFHWVRAHKLIEIPVFPHHNLGQVLQDPGPKVLFTKRQNQ